MSEAAVVTDPASVKADYRVAKAGLLAKFKGAHRVDALMQALSRTTDDALRRAWNVCALPATCALVAVGGYGRGELAPYSDIDILVLLPDNAPSELDAQIERFIGMAWDLGLELGSSVRTVAQCIEEAGNDITVRTSLLEALQRHARCTRILPGESPRNASASCEVPGFAL